MHSPAGKAIAEVAEFAAQNDIVTSMATGQAIHRPIRPEVKQAILDLLDELIRMNSGRILVSLAIGIVRAIVAGLPTLAILLLLAIPAMAQDSIKQRLDRIEATNADMLKKLTARLDGLDGKVDALQKSVDALKLTPKAKTPPGTQWAPNAVRTVSQPATPFSGQSSLVVHQADADDSGPWLSVGEHRKLWDMWPAGMTYPKGIGFYKLTPVSQSVDRLSLDGSPLNLIPRRPFVPMSSGAENVNREFPYRGSGGLDWAKPGTWRNATGLLIPDGKKINVWEGPKVVTTSSGSKQSELALHWSFPDGTQMFDVLIRKNADGSEHIFTIRKREKLSNGKWTDGVSFFPDVQTTKESLYATAGTKRTRVIGVEKVSYRVASVAPISGKPKFIESRIAMEDGGHFFPPGFLGAGISCNKCHVASMANEEAPYSGPMLRGMDSVFSWHPIDVRTMGQDKPGIDHRWPIRVVSK